MSKKIFLFIDSLGPGGAQRQFVGLACFLKQKFYEVKAASYYDQPFYLQLLQDANISYECFHVNSKLSLPKLVKSIKNFNADVLISFQTDPNSLACVAAKLCGVKLIVSERNTHQSISLKDKIIFNLYRLADYVVPNSCRVSGGNFTLPSLGTVLDSLPSHGSSHLTLLFINLYSLLT